jgi:putative redox protein
MKREKLEFKGSMGAVLSARLDLPEENDPVAYALFAHCFTCTKNLKAIYNIDKSLTSEGIGVLRFDFTGIGESEGDFADTNFSSNVADLVAAADFLRSNYQAPKLLIGHSLGGAAVLQAADQINSCRAVVTIAAPAEPRHLANVLRNERKEIERSGAAEVEIAGSRFRITKQFIDDLEQKNMEKIIGNLKRALLIFHAPGDKIVGIENAAQIFSAAKHPKSFVSLHQADHLLMEESDSVYAGKIAAVWASKYL